MVSSSENESYSFFLNENDFILMCLVSSLNGEWTFFKLQDGIGISTVKMKVSNMLNLLVCQLILTDLSNSPTLFLGSTLIRMLNIRLRFVIRINAHLWMNRQRFLVTALRRLRSSTSKLEIRVFVQSSRSQYYYSVHQRIFLSTRILFCPPST